MKEIYLVITSEGEYEDYRENVERAYTSKEAAEKYIKELDDKRINDTRVIEDYEESEEYMYEYKYRNPDLFKNPYNPSDNPEKYYKEMNLIKKRMDTILLDYLNRNFGYSFTLEDLELIEESRYTVRHPSVIQTVTLYDE